MKTEIKNILWRNNVTLPFSDILGPGARRELPQFDYSSPYEALRMKSLIAMGEAVLREMRTVRRSLHDACRECPEVALLASIPGIGELTALALLLEIGEISRFPTKESLVNYFGLCPATYRSGSSLKRGRITKFGSSLIRYLFYEASLKITEKNAPVFAALYARLVGAGKKKNVARIAVARRMLELCWIILKKREPFAPAYPSFPARDREPVPTR